MTTDDTPHVFDGQEPPMDLFTEVLDLADEVVSRVTDDDVEVRLRGFRRARRQAGETDDTAPATRLGVPAPPSGHEPPPQREWPATTLLGRLPDPIRKEFLRLGAFREYTSDEVLLREGDGTDFVVLLLNGWVKVTATAENGGFTLLAIAHGGDLIGEQAGLNGEPRSATVTAAGAVLATVMPFESFAAFLRHHPETAAAVLQTVSAKLRDATRRRVEFGGCSVAVRLARVLVELERAYGKDATDGPGRRLQIALTQPELAAMVGAAEPTVHKVLRELRQNGVMDVRYRSIVIRDVDALHRAAAVNRTAFRRTLLLAVDVMGYSRGDNRRQMAVQEDLLEVLQRAADCAGMSRARWHRQPAGDGELAVLPPEESESRVVDNFVRELHSALAQRNDDRRPEDRLRLRLAIDHGVATPINNGFAGPGVAAVSRLVASRPLRAALRSSKADLAVALSGRVFNDTIAQRHTTLRTTDFRRVHFWMKEFAATAWIRVPGVDPADLELAEPSTESRTAAPRARPKREFWTATPISTGRNHRPSRDDPPNATRTRPVGHTS